MSCCNLPQLLKKENYKNFSEYFNSIYNYFIDNIIGKKLGTKIIEFQYPKNKQTLWHIITKEDSFGKRTISYERAEHISWLSTLIKQHLCINCNDYYIWKELHSKSKRYRKYVYCRAERYIAIFEEYKDILFLVTAFIVTPQKDKEFMRKYSICT